MNRNKVLSYIHSSVYIILVGVFFIVCQSFKADVTKDKDVVYNKFQNPPALARPGVYWYFMDGNLSKRSITEDLESMKKVGIGYVIFLEVNLGLPRGNVDFMSDKWLDIFKHIVSESKRLGIQITLGVGPGWTGSGGPWVKGDESMQHLVSSSVTLSGNGNNQKIILPKPDAKKPYFGTGSYTPEMKKHWEEYYKDVVVLAFPTPEEKQMINNIDDKALYYRDPYSSNVKAKQYLSTNDIFESNNPKAIIKKDKIIDLSSLMNTDGTLEWNVPKGRWTIMRFGSRNNGSVTRPAPLPGVGMECDKFDTLALDDHLKHFTDKLFKVAGPELNNGKGGIKMLHMDSWEMGAQNWTGNFRKEFKKRRGYDPQPFYPVYNGLIVESKEVSERFLWDLRQTSQDLILTYHVAHLRQYAKKYGLGLTIEPYDMNPTSDMELGCSATMPMCEFWSIGYGGFNTSYSAIEGTSAAHIIGQPIVPSESFTSHHDGWRKYPGSMKNQTDWALAAGINRLYFHTFQHQCLNDTLRPGMTMGAFGVHWDRNQTWWPMSIGYHKYIARCQYMLQQGRTVADILYLVPEGAPHVFKAPKSALSGIEPYLPDRKGYNFDACPPCQLYKAKVVNNRIVFPSGATYRILVLPYYKTMTPKLLTKIADLIAGGLTVVGVPPKKSPSLVGYPGCDKELQTLVEKIWGNELSKTKSFGKGKIYSEGKDTDNLYQPYNETAQILRSMEILPDFQSTGDNIRYTHRRMNDKEIYFLSNRINSNISVDGKFRIFNMIPELWDPMTGKRFLITYKKTNEGIEIPLNFAEYQSCFVVFEKRETAGLKNGSVFSNRVVVDTLSAPWNVSFDSKWGGPKEVVFKTLTDWSKSDDKGIRYYSGIAVYNQRFDFLKKREDAHYYLRFNDVKVMAHVWLNGKDMGIVWTNPLEVEITSALKPTDNEIKIEVANLWSNRLIGDEQYPYDGIENKQWPDWFLKKQPRPSARYTFTTYRLYQKGDSLYESGIIGPICIVKSEE